jgi:ankyrin repeat protein
LKDNEGRTPLSFAAEEAHAETIQSLLRYGASPTIVDIRQKGLLHYTIGDVNCRMETVKTLLMLSAPTDLGPKPSERDENQRA